MSNKPIFVATHPRACSTAFERVFMTRRDSLRCVHEPFGDAFYYGPERLSSRFEDDENGRIESGFEDSTFKTVLDRIEKEGAEQETSPFSVLQAVPKLFLKVDVENNLAQHAELQIAGIFPSLIVLLLFGRRARLLQKLNKGVLTLVQGKRLFIKDIIHYMVPPNGAPSSIAPSLDRKERGVGTSKSDAISHTNSTSGAPYPFGTEAEPGNPTVIPKEVLGQFHFTFLIRHPRYSIPSYYRCTVPPLDQLTRFYTFMPSEAGYDELRRVFDYLRCLGQVGPEIATHESPKTNGHSEHGNGTTNGHSANIEICVVDADDLLDNPKGIVEAYCSSVGMAYDEGMLNWDSEVDQKQAKDAFEKWPGFHEDAMNSCDLKPRLHKKQPKSKEVEDNEWREKFGEKGAKVIRETVDANVEDYEYLKQFALRV